MHGVVVSGGREAETQRQRTPVQRAGERAVAERRICILSPPPAAWASLSLCLATTTFVYTYGTYVFEGNGAVVVHPIVPETSRAGADALVFALAKGDPNHDLVPRDVAFFCGGDAKGAMESTPIYRHTDRQGHVPTRAHDGVVAQVHV